MKRNHSDSQSQPKAQMKKPSVEEVNSLSTQDFFQQYAPQAPIVIEVDAPAGSKAWTIRMTAWSQMIISTQEACIGLIESTSSHHYRSSEIGWSRSGKWKEMSHPAMKYLLLVESESSDSSQALGGFTSFMITEEDGYFVAYCYEIHLSPALQGRAVGKQLMDLIEAIGREVGVDKVMLTVFKSNQAATKAYHRWNYVLDQFSPRPRKLRRGAVQEPSYVILSKDAAKFALKTSALSLK